MLKNQSYLWAKHAETLITAFAVLPAPRCPGQSQYPDRHNTGQHRSATSAASGVVGRIGPGLVDKDAVARLITGPLQASRLSTALPLQRRSGPRCRRERNITHRVAARPATRRTLPCWEGHAYRRTAGTAAVERIGVITFTM